MLNPMSTAGLVVIGDEILSGKTADTNTPFLIAELRGLGVALREIAVVPDSLDEIAAAISRLSAHHDLVFTSGGVGPTHDDVTLLGVARAFDAPIERHPVLEQMMRAYFDSRGQPLPERNLRMADVPRGATLVTADNLHWPVLQVGNVYVLPGVPEVFRRKFLAIRERFRVLPFHLRQLFLREEEALIADHLDEVVAAHPAVSIGSYPRWTPAPDGHKVKITVEGKDPQEVGRAYEHLQRLVGPDAVVRGE
jgi:molybdenum cofactor synthesis domain-containing protein